MNLLAFVVAATSIAVSMLPLSSVANLEKTATANTQDCRVSDRPDGDLSCPRVPAIAPTSTILIEEQDICESEGDGRHPCPHGMGEIATHFMLADADCEAEDKTGSISCPHLQLART